MSTSAPKFPSASTGITCIAPEHFEPKLVIADILRTRYCVPGSIFLVEGIDIVYTSRSKRRRAVRFLLGDGDLCVQALLSAEMHGFADRGEIVFGSYVKLEQFRLESRDLFGDSMGDAPTSGSKRTEAVSPGARDRVAYLVVDDLVLVGWNNTLVNSVSGSSKESRAVPIQEDEEMARSISTTADAARGVDALQAHEDANNSADFIMEAQRKELLDESPTSGYLPWLSNDPTKPLKLTKLRAIPNLPYKQNWSVNILAVVSAISDLEPSGLPPYHQRQARLADPSTDKHVLLTVFLDPQEFAPSVGNVVLLLGVKNHRFDGGSLKKYASDRVRSGESWWYENPAELLWCDVAGLTCWWRNK